MNVISSLNQPSQAGTLRSETPQLKNEADSAKAAMERNETKAQDALLNRLAKHVPGVSAEDMRKQNAEDFTPDKVADRVAGFVGMGLDQARAEGRSEADIQKMHEAAMRGIEKGFAEAKEILEGLDILNQGNIEPTIDETFDKTMAAVQALLPSNDNQVSGPRRGAEAFYASERYASAETFSLSLTTQDGDEVTIEFGNAEYQNISAAGASAGGSSALSTSLERGSASSMYFSVEGDLSDEELGAINDLLRDVNDIADEFFDGDIQAAFDKATEFEMDGSQLASMNLRLTRTETYSAASAYSAVGSLPSFGNADALAPLNDMGSKLNALAEDPRTAFMEEADKMISKILDGLVQQDTRFKDADDDTRSRLDNNLKLMDDMMDALFDRNTPAVTAPAEASTEA